MSEHIEKKAQEICAQGNVQSLSDSEYLVKSNTSGVIYGVEIGNEGIYKCSCKAGEHRGFCSHIEAVKLQREKQNETTNEQLEVVV